MKKDVNKNMQKKLDRKKELEKIANKSLTVFTVGLILEVILIFFSSALKVTGATRATLDNFICTVAVIAIIVFLILLAIGLYVKKNGKEETGKEVLNWSIFSLFVFLGASMMAETTVIPAVFSFIGLTNIGGVIALKLVPLSGANGAYILMAVVALYVVVMFIYHTALSNKIKKSK